MREVEKHEANYVVIISDSSSKRVKYKFYFDLGEGDCMEEMLQYIIDKYKGAINITSRIDFARVMLGETFRREL